jgi:hypothetical protein
MMNKRWILGCAALLGVVLAGCYPEKRIFWSPDGKTAGVIANERLYFCDDAGALTPHKSLRSSRNVLLKTRSVRVEKEARLLSISLLFSMFCEILITAM